MDNIMTDLIKEDLIRINGGAAGEGAYLAGRLGTNLSFALLTGGAILGSSIGDWVAGLFR